MKKKLLDPKSIFIGIAVGALLFSGIVTASTLVSEVYLNPFPVYANGTRYNPTSPLLNYQGKTYVPLSEFGTLTNSDVRFTNNTIYVNSNYNTNYNYYNPTKTYSDLDVEVDETETFYVNLNKYGARNATITYSNSYVKLSKSYVTSSGSITVTGKKEGKTTIKISYNTGNIDYINVNVTNDDDDDYEEEFKLEVGDTDSFYVDLEDYDADKATLSYDSNYIKLSKTTLYSSGKVTITAKKEGDTTIKIKYDTGDIDYIYVEVCDDNDDYEEEFKLEVGDTDSFYVDLENYDADKATLSYDSNYIKLSKTTLYSSGKVTITAKKEGDTTIKIKYDTGDVDYIYVEIYDDIEDDDDYDHSKIEFNNLDSVSFYINLDYYDADKATLTYDDKYVNLSKTTFTTPGKVIITAKKPGTTTVKVKYDTGDIEYIDLKIY